MKTKMVSPLVTLICLELGDSYGSQYESKALNNPSFTIDITTLPKMAIENLKPTDDTKMAYQLLLSLNQCTTVNARELPHKIRLQRQAKKAKEYYKEYANTEQAIKDQIGIHTYNVLIKNETDYSEGNGHIMRILPFAYYHYLKTQDTEIAIELDADNTKHSTKYEALLLLKIALKLVPISELENEIKDTPRTYNAWTKDTLHCIYIAWQNIDNTTLEEGFKHLVILGGDTDTNCAIYGAMYAIYKQQDNEILNILDQIKTTMPIENLYWLVSQTTSDSSDRRKDNWQTTIYTSRLTI